MIYWYIAQQTPAASARQRGWTRDATDRQTWKTSSQQLTYSTHSKGKWPTVQRTNKIKINQSIHCRPTSLSPAPAGEHKNQKKSWLIAVAKRRKHVRHAATLCRQRQHVWLLLVYYTDTDMTNRQINGVKHPSHAKITPPLSVHHDRKNKETEKKEKEKKKRTKYDTHRYRRVEQAFHLSVLAFLHRGTILRYRRTNGTAFAHSRPSSGGVDIIMSGHRL